MIMLAGASASPLVAHQTWRCAPAADHGKVTQHSRRFCARCLVHVDSFNPAANRPGGFFATARLQTTAYRSRHCAPSRGGCVPGRSDRLRPAAAALRRSGAMPPETASMPWQRAQFCANAACDAGWHRRCHGRGCCPARSRPVFQVAGVHRLRHDVAVGARRAHDHQGASGGQRQESKRRGCFMVVILRMSSGDASRLMWRQPVNSSDSAAARRRFPGRPVHHR